MTDPEQAVKRALELSGAGCYAEAFAILSEIVDVEPKPVRFWLAVAQCNRGEDFTYHSLNAYAADIQFRRAEILGLEGSSIADLLMEDRSEMAESFSRYQRGDHSGATSVLSRVILRRSDALQELQKENLRSKLEGHRDPSQ
jgi:hypothetical protein